jgi:predicted transcriptional regulator
MAKTLRRTIELSRPTRNAQLKRCRGPQDLSRLELECIRAIWLNQAATVAQVQACLWSSRPLAYTTVLTILDRLTRKGAVTRTQRGKAYIYKPVLSFEDARDTAVAGLMDFYFEGSPVKLIDYLKSGDSRSEPRTRSSSEREPFPSLSAAMQDCLL